MWNRLYRNHVIMAFPSYRTAANAWVPQADITWFCGASRDFKFVRFAKRCTTEDEATNWALTRSQRWIDNRLRRLQLGSKGNEVGAFGKAADTASPKPPSRARPTTGARLKRAFSFEQFKTTIAARGLKLSESLLRKSYAALVDLRHHEHWSWAEARRRAKRSPDELKVERSPRWRSSSAPIPVTELDWRRIR